MSQTIGYEELVRAARVYAAECVGWIAPALYSAPVVLSEAIPMPAAIDRYGRVYFNPRWLDRLQGDRLAQVGFLWVHEVWHWLREHEIRAREIHANPELWNIACDLEINDYIPPGLELPDFGEEFPSSTPQQFQLPVGQVAEWYYRQLQQQRQQQQQQSQQQQQQSQQQQQQGQGQSQQQQQQGQGQSQQQQQQPQQQQQQGQGQSQQQTQPGQASQNGQSTANGTQAAPTYWDEGSGVHGQPRAWELPPDSPQAQTLSDFDRQALKEEVARRILEAHKNRGTVPAQMLRWAEETLKPRVNWREQLKRVLRGAINDGFGQRLDYSFRRMNRRAALYDPFLMPALHGEYRPRIAVVVDTSGSISDAELSQAMAEVRAVLEQVRTQITVIPCDARTYDAVRIHARRDWEMARHHLRGGGGTDMRVGIETAKRLKPEPDAILVLTDGYTPFPETPPKHGEPLIIWGIWRYGDDAPPKPPSPPWRKRDVIEIPILR
jgi:predicted metal-dependent peptidase